MKGKVSFKALLALINLFIISLSLANINGCSFIDREESQVAYDHKK